MADQLSIGIIGAGSFALFAAQAFSKIEGVRIHAVSDIDLNTAKVFAGVTHSAVYEDHHLLLADPIVDLVYIASPPFMHASQSGDALRAGKHVICEKPAGIVTAEAEALAAYARDHDLLYTVNLMQRYNPLYHFVTDLIREKWLGDFVHGFFENYASDEKLIPQHWFWDRAMSGGIFIEHGVHFFDMFSGWFGKGEVIHAVEVSRGNIVDRVQAVVTYGQNPVNFYHGFNQPKVLDRQELRLQFDKGDITLYEWIPVRIRIHGLLPNKLLEKILQLLPHSEVEIHESHGSTQTVRGKFKDIEYDVLATISSGDISEKMNRYEQLITSMFIDQWMWIRDRTHRRVIDETNAVESLREAEEATLKAQLI